MALRDAPTILGGRPVKRTIHIPGITVIFISSRCVSPGAGQAQSPLPATSNRCIYRTVIIFFHFLAGNFFLCKPFADFSGNVFNLLRETTCMTFILLLNKVFHFFFILFIQMLLSTVDSVVASFPLIATQK